MIAGHFGLAAVVKAREPQVPLWSLMLATVWLDVVFAPLFIAGIETIEPAPGASGYGAGIIHAAYTHSLVGAIALSLLFGVVAAIPWGRRAGTVLGAVVFSHWLLDLVVHRPDLPILPGNAAGLPLLGVGLWQIPAAAAAVELGLLAIGTYLYWRAAVHTTQASGRTGVAHRVAAALAISGLATLGLDLLGI